MAKAPAFQFYVKDWLSDPLLRQATPVSRGIWIDVLCYMWGADKRGLIETTPLKLSRMVSADIDEVNHFLNEMIDLEFGDLVTKKEIDFPIMQQNCNDDVTLINRRMYSDYKDKENTRLRVKKYREAKRLKRNRNGKSNGDVTGSSSTATASALRNDLSKDKSPAGDHFKNKIGEYLNVVLAEIDLIHKYKQNGAPLNQRTLFQWVQEKSNQSGHPKAIFRSLSWLRELLERGENVKSFRAMAEKTFQTVNPKFHGRDSEAESNAFKNAVIENDKIKQFIEWIGN